MRAAALVRAARAQAENLIERAFADVAEQRRTSASTGSLSLDGATRGRADRLATIDGDPRAVAAWWASMTDDERAWLIDRFPDRIGATEGIPYADRDRANRATLERLLQGDDLSSGQRAALEAVLRELDNGGSPTQLILLDVLDGSARAAIAVGDLDSAGYATVIVPGMNSTVKDSMQSTMDAARAVDAQMRELLLRSDGGTGAVVAWIGYEAPGYDTVGQGDHARAGAVHLPSMIEGNRAAQDHAGRTPFLHVLAHPYGSTTAANALAETSGVDAFTMFGSAGIENTLGSAGDLNVPTGQVYVTESPDDGIADVGRNISGRQDPSAAGFDAVNFGSRDTTGHNMIMEPAHPWVETVTGPQYGYLNPGTQSLKNIGLIAVGEGAPVTK